MTNNTTAFTLTLFVDNAVNIPEAEAICQQAADILAAKKILSANSHANIKLSDDMEVQALNKQYRGKDKPTNVLSFPDGDTLEGICQLGDIILAKETLEAEATEAGVPLKHHLSHLAIHGLLHLLGYDHETEEDAQKMEALEIEFLSKLGIKNPY